MCLARDIDPNEHYRLPKRIAADRSFSSFIPDQNPALDDRGFFFGHTPDKHVFRIMPNHYLDMEKLELKRFWPTSDIENDLSVTDAAGIIATRLEQVMGGFMDSLSGYFSISGGKDSRMLLACSASFELSKFKLHSYATNWISTFDVKIAQVLADSLNQGLLVQIPNNDPKATYFPRKKRSLRMAQRFTISSGLWGVCDEWWRRGYAMKLDSNENWIRGNFLETVTARFWPRGDLGPNENVQHLFSRLGNSSINQNHLNTNLELLEGWLGSFENLNVQQNLHDYSYQELALNASQPFFHAVNVQFYIGPAADRLIFETAMRV